MAETIGMLLIISAVGVWMLVNGVQRLLNRKNELRPQRLSIFDAGLSK